MGWIVFGLTAALAALLLFRLLALKRQLRALSRQLAAEDKRVSISLVDAGLERLAEQINDLKRQRQEAEIRAARQEQELRTAISCLAHDLRTPLTSVIGYASLSRRDPSQLAHALEVIETKGKLLDDLIGDFYSLSLAEDPDYEFPLERVDLTSVLTDCLAGSYILFEQKGIVPRLSLPQEAVWVRGNRVACERIALNLLHNALRHTTGALQISLARQDGWGVLTMENEAQRLDPAAVPHLFERFFTGDSARTAGSGLGLYTVQVLLARMEGYAEASSECGFLKIKTAMRLCD